MLLARILAMIHQEDDKDRIINTFMQVRRQRKLPVSKTVFFFSFFFLFSPVHCRVSTSNQIMRIHDTQSSSLSQVDFALMRTVTKLGAASQQS